MSQNTLFVCVLCQFMDSPSKLASTSPGQTLFNQLQDGLTSTQDSISLQPVRCLGACDRACVVAFAAVNKLTFVLSGLSPTESVADLMKFSQQYSTCPDGKVPFRDRPETIKRSIHAVLPVLPTPPLSSSSGNAHA
jgi:predicted metal-binding protein